MWRPGQAAVPHRYRRPAVATGDPYPGATPGPETTRSPRGTWISTRGPEHPAPQLMTFALPGNFTNGEAESHRRTGRYRDRWHDAPLRVLPDQPGLAGKPVSGADHGRWDDKVLAAVAATCRRADRRRRTEALQAASPPGGTSTGGPVSAGAAIRSAATTTGWQPNPVCATRVPSHCPDRASPA